MSFKTKKKELEVSLVSNQRFYLCNAFKKGIKDVVFFTVSPSGFNMDAVEILRKKKYFRKTVKRGRGRVSYFFFKTKELKQEFEDKFYSFVKNDEIRKIEVEFGKFLGFPPKACEHFSKWREGEKNILVNYDGMVFASYPKTIKNDISWLLENKPFEDFIKVGEYIYLKEDGLNSLMKLIDKVSK